MGEQNARQKIVTRLCSADFPICVSLPQSPNAKSPIVSKPGRGLPAFNRKKNHSWFFQFGERGSVVTEGLWRFINNHRVEVSSEDDGQQFGLPEPIDSAKCVSLALQDKPILSTRVDKSTGDLFIYFSESTFLQFLQMSGRYEAWRFTVGNLQFICTGGGEIVTCSGKS